MKRDESWKFENQICFALYTASRLVIQGYGPRLESLGVSYLQYMTLLILWERDGLSVKQIAERMLLDSGTLTPMLKRMESKGLIRRIRDPEDERSVLISLTQKGQQMHGHGCTIAATVGSDLGLSQKKLKLFKDEFNELIGRLKKGIEQGDL